MPRPIDRSLLTQLDVSRAMGRRHKACPTHGKVRRVCTTCARVWCPKCEPRCPRCATPVLDRAMQPAAYVRPRADAPRLQAVLDALEEYTVLAIEPHEDSGGFMLLFPYQEAGATTSNELAQKVYERAADWLRPTAFGSGRLFNPDRYYVTFHLR